MRKKILLFLIVALFVSIMPVAAQDEEEVEEVPACTEEDLGVTFEAINGLSAGFEEVTAGMTDSSDAEAVTAAVLGIDTLASGFWNEIYPELPYCFEASALAYSFGLVLDETLINVGLLRLALYEAEHGDAELAQSYAEYAAARSEWYAEIVNSTFGVMAETGEIPESLLWTELESCTPEDQENEAAAMMGESIATYQELSAAAAEATPEEVTALIAGYAVLSSTHWIEVYPALPCLEASEFGHNLGLVYDGSLISLLLSRLAVYEEEHGDPEVAALYADASLVRLEMLQMFAAEVFPEAEAAEEE